MTSLSASKPTKEVFMTISSICKFENCKKSRHARGWCPAHYKQWRTTGTLKPLRVPTEFCGVEACGKKHKEGGYCSRHNYYNQTYGDPLTPPRQYKEGQRSDPLYSTWMAMKSRCYVKSAGNYKYYGAKGVRVCAEWLGVGGFKQFKTDMGDKPEGCSLDRIDSEGDYAAKNCRWADIHVQNGNKRPRSSTGFLGVCEMPSGSFRAEIKRRGKTYRLGFYKTPEQANNVVAAKRRELDE